MRIRRFLLAGLVVGGVVMAMPQGAYAATDHNKEVFECVEKAIEDNQRYQEDIHGLRSDPDVIERIGREEWKLIRPGEVMIELPDDSAPSKKDQPTEKDSSKE